MFTAKLTDTMFSPKPLATIGDEKDEITYTAIGRALSRWESAEIRVASLFALLIAMPTPLPAIRAYGSVATFQVRKQMVLGAADSFFNTHPNDELHKKIKDLFSKYFDKAGSRRTEIAHGIVISKNPTKRKRQFFLAPAYYSSKNYDHKFNPAYLYSSKEIGEYREAFEQLTIYTHNWRQSLLKKAARPH